MGETDLSNPFSAQRADELARDLFDRAAQHGFVDRDKDTADRIGRRNGDRLLCQTGAEGRGVALLQAQAGEVASRLDPFQAETSACRQLLKEPLGRRDGAVETIFES